MGNPAQSDSVLQRLKDQLVNVAHRPGGKTSRSEPVVIPAQIRRTKLRQREMAQRHIALYQRILEGKPALGDSGKRPAISG